MSDQSDKNIANSNLSTKLVAGAVLGLGGGLVGLVPRSTVRRQSTFSRLVMGLFLLAQHCDRNAHADHDFSGL